MFKVLVVLIFLIFINPLFVAGDDSHRIDSLETLLNQTHDIDEKMDLYIPLIIAYRSININKAKQYANHAFQLAKGTNSQYYLGKFNGSLGDIAIAQDSVEIARVYYEQALTHYEADENLDGIVSILTILGNIAFVQDDLSDAMQYYHKGIKIALEEDFQIRLNRLYLNIGSVLIRSNQYVESQKYTTIALNNFLSMGDTIEIAQTYSNLGLVYIGLKDYETATNYFSKALEIYQKKDAIISVASTYEKLAEIEQIKGYSIKAIRLLQKARELAEENMITQFEGPKQLILNSITVNLGFNYFLVEEYDRAYLNLISGYKNSILGKQPLLSRNATDYLYQYWNSKGNTDSALFYHRLFKYYSDSIHEDVNNRKLALQGAQFEFEQQAIKEQQEREIHEERQQRNLIILLITIVVLVLVLLLLTLLLRLNRIKIKESQHEQESLRNELSLRNKELTTYLIYQVKNNEFIVNISNKLKKILWKSSVENKSLVNELIREIETDSSSDNWDEFIVRFQQVHTDFYKNLGKKYPDLTSNELRLCAFLKLNMNTKDIAAITYQSTKSITVARWRLRQKLGLLKEERLAAYLSRF